MTKVEKMVLIGMVLSSVIFLVSLVFIAKATSKINEKGLKNTIERIWEGPETKTSETSETSETTLEQ